MPWRYPQYCEVRPRLRRQPPGVVAGVVVRRGALSSGEAVSVASEAAADRGRGEGALSKTFSKEPF